MVRIVIDGDEGSDQAGSGLGFLSFQFLLGAEVTNTSSTGFTLSRSSTSPFPGLPVTPDPAPDVYSGQNLTFTDITHGGTTLTTPSSGLITSVLEQGDDFTTTGEDLNIDAADFYRVSLSESNDDNVQLLKDVFRGDDTFLGGNKRDKFNGFGGNDSLDGRRGSDRIWGGGGEDSLYGGKGADVLRGQGGNDELFGQRGHDRLLGGAGDDRLIGGHGKDTLEGGKGDDVLNGQGGFDVFVFRGSEQGRDTIENWADGKDRIQIIHQDVVDLSDLTLTTVGGDLEITYDDNTIVLQGAGGLSMDATDFIF